MTGPIPGPGSPGQMGPQTSPVPGQPGPRKVDAAGLPNRREVPHVVVQDMKWQDAQILDLDPGTLNPDRHYRWVRCRSDEHMASVAKHRRRGYSIETLQGGVKTVVEPDSRADGAIAIGDLVLMSCPKADHERRIADRQRRSEQLLASTTADTVAEAKRKGISLIQDADHNRETIKGTPL